MKKKTKEKIDEVLKMDRITLIDQLRSKVPASLYQTIIECSDSFMTSLMIYYVLGGNDDEIKKVLKQRDNEKTLSNQNRRATFNWPKHEN